MSDVTVEKPVIAPLFITAPDAGVLLSVSKDKIMELVNAGELPAYDLGPRSTRLKLSEVIAYAESQPYEPGKYAA